MDKYIINGGNKLCGSVDIECAKNAVLPIIAASILCDDKVVIEKCPKILDVLNMLMILSDLGVKSTFFQNNLIIDSTNINSYTVKQKYAKRLRSSVLMIGALLSKFRRVAISYPGGCDIGIRPIDMHISALKNLGVTVSEHGSDIVCACDKLLGGEVYLDFPSVGATENIIISSVLAEGRTIIHNAAKEPEIVDLCKFLNLMGGNIKGAGQNEITIEGVKKLHGVTYKPMDDRIEAGTFLIAGALTGGEIEVRGVNVKNISPLLSKFCDNACKVSIKNDIIHLKGGKNKKPFAIKTGPYPFFPTDLQPQISVLASVSQGVSIIEENVFEMRFKHIAELLKMGADISVMGRTAIVNGVRFLHGAEVYSYDLRGGASMVLAGLVAEGRTTVFGTRHIERGYLNFDRKLASLGADISKKK